MEVKRKKNEMKFSLIASGECFIDRYDNVCIKFDDVIPHNDDDESYNAVDVVNGVTYYYYDDEIVTPVKSTLIIE